jgi:predicted transcriptional regulator
MTTFSTRGVARKLGITHAALSKYISSKKVPAPRSVTSGGMTIHLWTEMEIENVRKLLPKIANGRKTRWQRQKQIAAQAREPVPHKKRGTKKKK